MSTNSEATPSDFLLRRVLDESFSRQAPKTTHRSLVPGHGVGKPQAQYELSSPADVWSAIEKSQLFDACWYSREYLGRECDFAFALHHYMSVGWRMNFEPNYLFDSKWYRRSLTSSDSVYDNPLVDFLARDASEWRDPHPIFDMKWYAGTNPDVASLGINPLAHYLHHGASELRDPHPLFDAARVAAQLSAAGISTTNPLVDYLKWDDDLELSPHQLFDGVWYRGQFGDKLPECAGLRNFIEHWRDSGMTPHPLFDHNLYMEESPDLFDKEFNPLSHYVQFGGRELRRPHTLFDPVWYLRLYPDAFQSPTPLGHYLTNGASKGLSPHPLFDGSRYSKRYLDASVEVNPLVDYLVSDRGKFNSPHALFDGTWYLRVHSDVADGEMNPLLHYLLHGFRENRKPNVLFDERWYRERYLAGRIDVPGLVHYVYASLLESPRPLPAFDGEFYAQQCVPESTTTALGHYLDGGFRSATNPHPLFLNEWYRETYLGESIDSDVVPLADYLEKGLSHGRDPSPMFDSLALMSRHESIRQEGINPLTFVALAEMDGDPVEVTGKGFPPDRELKASSLVRFVLDHRAEVSSLPLRSSFEVRGVREGLGVSNGELIDDLGYETLEMNVSRVLGEPEPTVKRLPVVLPYRYVARLPDALVRTTSRLIVPRGRRIVLHDEYADREAHHASKSAGVGLIGSELFMRAGPTNRYLERGIHLMHEHGTNYFHWVVEVLPRLLLVKDRGLGNYPLILSNRLHANYLRLLELVNRGEFRLQPVEEEIWLYVEELIYPSDVCRTRDIYAGTPQPADSALISPELIGVREMVLASLPEGTAGGEGVLYLRRGQRTRGITNEDQLVSALSEVGVEVVPSEGMTVRQQVALFRSARTIIVPTGAVMTNVIWCQPGTKVVCLISDHEALNLYFWQQLADISGAEVVYFRGTRMFEVTGLYSMHDSFRVDASALVDLLRDQRLIQ